MGLFPEKEPQIPVSEIPEFPEIPEDIEKAGVRPISTTAPTVVPPNGSFPPVQSPASQGVTVNVPVDNATLTSWSKGDTSSSLTWLGAFWLRVVKKALHFGWKIMTGGS